MSGTATPSGSATLSTNAATYAGPAPGVWTGPKRCDLAKLEPYEGGIEPTRQPPGDGTISVRFFVIAMLLFMAHVYVAYAYLWRRVRLE